MRNASVNERKPPHDRPVIHTEKLTKSYGEHRGIVDVDLTVNEGEAFGFLGPNGAGKTTTIRTLLDHIRPTSGRATIFGIDTTEDPVAIHRRLGYLPGEFTLYDKLTGGQTLEYFANLRGGVDSAYQQDLIARLDVDPSPQVPRVLEGQQAEDRAHHRPPASARPAPARRADVRPRSADPAGVLRRHPRGQGRGPDGVPLVAHPVRGREDLRSGGDHPRRPSGPRRPDRGAARPRPPPGGAGVHRHACRWRSSARCPACRTSWPRITPCGCASPAASPRSCARPRSTSWPTSSAASRRSRRPSWPSTARTRSRRRHR